MGDEVLFDEEREFDGLRFHIRLCRSEWLPPRELVTSAFALAFDKDRLLLTRLVARGWDLPGGHLEPGEPPEDAMRREVFEEAAVALTDASVFAHEHIRLLAEPPAGYRYPAPDSYQLFYAARVVTVGALVPTDEALEAGLFGPTVVHDKEWVIRNRTLYEAALKWAQA